MPSFGDTALIALIALLLFGPKKLPELARQLGKLMGEFRRASNEFRMQMEDELRISEQEERQKKIAAIEAAAPVAPALPPSEPTIEHPHVPVEDTEQPAEHSIAAPAADEAPAPLPIASSGELDMMPPATGLPVSRSSSSSALSPVLDSIPHVQDPEEAVQPPAEHSAYEASQHG
jgi:sec-independent protein translocase protein TatB